MEPGLYKGGALQKIAGFSLIGFAVLLAAGAALRPGADVEDASSAIQTIADNSGGRWQVAHIVIALSFYALMIGMAGIYRSISSGQAAAWARLGFYIAIAGTTVRSVFLAVEGVGRAAVAEDWEAATGADKDTLFLVFSSLDGVLEGLRSITDIVSGLSFAMLGVAILLSTVYSRWLGWTILVAGGGWIVVGLVIGANGLSDAVNAPFVIVIALTVVWAVAMGVVITRRERRAVDAS